MKRNRQKKKRVFPKAVTLLSALSTALLLIGATFGSDVFSTRASAPVLAQKKSIGPQDPITILFPQGVATKDYRKHIRVTPSLPFYAKWEDERTKLILTPQHFWDAEKVYSITLPDGATTKQAIIPNASLTFQTISHPKIISIFPADGAKDVLIGIEDPIALQLNTSSEEFFLEFVLSPAEKVVYQNNPEKTYFEILPQEGMRNGDTYTLTILSRLKYDATENAVPIFESSFTTMPPPPSEWSNNHAERIEQAKRFTKPAITEGKYIDINIDAQIMILFENSSIIAASLISSGLSGMDTPKGAFQIYNKHPRPWSRQYELFMPFWMAITPDGKYGIHELPEWPGGYKEGQNHLGIPVSHGCVRLGIGSAETAYNWAEVGTPVVIH